MCLGSTGDCHPWATLKLGPPPHIVEHCVLTGGTVRVLRKQVQRSGYGGILREYKDSGYNSSNEGNVKGLFKRLATQGVNIATTYHKDIESAKRF